jgi:hypothetical protein
MMGGMNPVRPSVLALLVGWFALAVARAACADDAYQPGRTYFGREQYVEYLAGDLPVILSAPHGGRLRPAELPDREQGTFAFDVNTQELARACAEELHRRTGRWPHVIICRLSRRKLDCNRDLPEAAAGHALAEQAWQEYHGFIEAARRSVVARQGRGLYIDLHGHGHQEQRLELGYLHSSQQLQATDAELNGPLVASDSSLRAIAALGRTSHAELLRGPLSFGALMEREGFLCTPSPSRPAPTGPYFRGGYSTQRHGREAVPIAGLQIETHSRGVRNTPASRAAFARALVSTLETYLPAHLGVELSGRRPAISRGGPPVCVSRSRGTRCLCRQRYRRACR